MSPDTGQQRRENDQADLVPRPDPTLLTTQQLVREISTLRNQLGREVESVRAIIETRLNAMDKAIELLRITTDLLPERVDEKITALRTVHDERFSSIAQRFGERDIRDERSSRDSKTAVDAALQAAKEAVNAQNISSALSITKSEAATDKRIDQQATLIQTATKALEGKIDDMKERLGRIEGTGLGKSQQTALSIAIGGLVLSAIAFMVGKAFF